MKRHFVITGFFLLLSLQFMGTQAMADNQRAEKCSQKTSNFRSPA